MEIQKINPSIYIEPWAISKDAFSDLKDSTMHTKVDVNLKH